MVCFIIPIDDEMTSNIGYLRTKEGMIVCGEVVSKFTWNIKNANISYLWIKRSFDELSRNQIYILQVMAVIGMILNVASFTQVTSAVLWFAFWLTFVVSGDILLFSLCGLYVPMLNKFKILIWLVRLHNIEINFVV